MSMAEERNLPLYRLRCLLTRLGINDGQIADAIVRLRCGRITSREVWEVIRLVETAHQHGVVTGSESKTVTAAPSGIWQSGATCLKPIFSFIVRE